LSLSAVEAELENLPDEEGIWYAVTRGIENPPTEITPTVIKEIVSAPNRLFSVIQNYMKMTSSEGMPLWYELQVDPEKEDYLLTWDDFRRRSGIYLEPVGETTTIATTLWTRAWDEDKNSAIAFSAEAKTILVEYLNNPTVLDVLKNVQLKPKEKMEALGKFFQDESPETNNSDVFSVNMQLLFLALVSEDKLSQLPGILKGIFMLGFAAQGGVIGQVTTLTPLPAKARKEFTEIVKKNVLAPTDNLVLQFKHSPSIKGGYILALPSAGLVDNSWSQIFEQLPAKYNQAVEHILRQYETGQLNTEEEEVEEKA